MQVLDKGYIELEDYMGNDNTIVCAARVSTLKKSKGAESDAKLIKYLLKNSHLTPFEMVVFQFRVKAPIFVARQWFRHRTSSISEQSRRYTDEDIEFHIPKTLRYQSTDNKQMSAGEFDIVKAEPLIDSIWKISDEAYRIYLMLLDNGVAREQARMVLPVNLYTSFYFKMDLRNLFHFLELRDHPHAQEEIRLYAQQIKKLIQPIVPVSYAAWEELNQSK